MGDYLGLVSAQPSSYHSTLMTCRHMQIIYMQTITLVWLHFELLIMPSKRYASAPLPPAVQPS